MPRPCSSDLRGRVLAACDGGERPSAVAKRFGVARASVYLWLRQRRDEGRTEAKRLGGGPKPTIRDAAEAALVRLVEDRGDRTLAEYADELAAAPAPGGVRVHPWTVGRALRRLGRTRKKKTLRATEQDEAAVAAARQAWPAALAGIDPARLVFIDESAALTDMVRAHARSPRGERARAAVPRGRWRRLTVIGALGLAGVAGALTIEAATSGAVFGAFLERVLLPELRASKPDAVLVMDNLAAHKTRAVRDLLERSGLAYRYLPPYSPDFNPIELAWAKVKAHLRAAAARTAEALHAAVGAALAGITPGDAAGFFRHAGYAAV